MRNILRNEKGITLIALVITIIVMLILVTVTIRVATNGSLFTHAANAVKGTKSAIEGENAILNDNLGIEAIVAEQTEETYTAYTVGETIRISGQDFYVIANSDEHADRVKLLAALNVDTSTNRQSSSAREVSYFEITSSVENYVSSLGVTVQEGRLMTLEEVELLGGNSTNGTTSECTGNSAFVNATRFWLGTEGTFDGGVWVVDGANETLGQADIDRSLRGLRPVIVILKTNIPAQD